MLTGMDATHLFLIAMLVIAIVVPIIGFTYMVRLSRTTFTPGEAAIYREMRRALDEYKP